MCQYCMNKYEVYSFVSSTFLNKRFYFIFKKESFWGKIEKVIMHVIYMEIARWFCPYCLEYYLWAYIVKHKLAIKHQANKAEFDKKYK